MDIQFVHDLLTMFFDGLDTDCEFRRDLFIGGPFSDQLQDFGFA